MEPTSELLTSSVEVSIGTPPSHSVQNQLSAHASIGGTDRSGVRALFLAAIGEELMNRQMPVIVMTCASPEKAEDLAWTINETWKQAVLGDSPDSFFSSLVSSWKDDEVLLANLRAEAVDSKLRVTVELAEWLLQHFKTYVYLLFAEAGDLLAHTQTASLNAEIGSSVWDMVQSSNFIVTMLSWAKISARAEIWAGLSERVEQLLEKYVRQPEICALYGMMALFAAGQMSVNFRSPNLLPRQVRELLPQPEMISAGLQMIRQKLTSDEKKVLEALAESVTGPLRVYWWTPHCSAEAQVEMAGLGRLVRTTAN